MFSQPEKNLLHCEALRICSWNIRGLTREKLDEEILGKLFNQYDILMLSETWFVNENELEIDNFKMYHFNRAILDKRAKRGSGGIAVYVKHEISGNVHPISSYCDNIAWFGLSSSLLKSEKPIAIGTVYLPPEGSTHNQEDLFAVLENDCARLMDTYQILICGDLNARTGNLSDLPIQIEGTDNPTDRSNSEERNYFASSLNKVRMSKDGTINSFGKKLIELCNTVDLRIVNGRMPQDNFGAYTRIENLHYSTVDYLLTDSSCSHLIHGFSVGVKLPESDHCLLSFQIAVTEKIILNKEIGTDISRYKWETEDLTKIANKFLEPNLINLKSKLNEKISEMADVDEITDIWLDFFTTTTDQVCTRKVSKYTNRKPKAAWRDNECLTLRKKVIEESSSEEKHGLSKKYKTMKQKKKREYKIKIMNNLEDACGRNGKLFWDTLNKLPSANTKRKNCLKPSIVCNDLKALSTIPTQPYFDLDFEQEVKLILEKYSTEDDFLHYQDKEACIILNSMITTEEIDMAVRKIKTGKSPGLDGIPVEFIKSTIDTIKPILETIFNYILTKEVYPQSWAHGLRVAIPKGEDDIRPITIEPIFAKILETIFDNRINFINDAFDKTDKFNGGFLKGSMTQDNLLVVTSCIQKQLSLSKNLFIAFVDFKKAFNYVNHNILFYKLIKSGISGRFFNLLRNMYSKIKARVKVNNCLYDWIDDTCGTNQGGPLSPNMFRYMLNDLKDFLDDQCGIVVNNNILVHMLWADDLVLLSDSASGLQRQLDGLLEFCSKYQMIVNELKTKVMIYGKPTEDIFKFNGKSLDIVSEYKYLGVIFNNTVNLKANIFKNMIQYIAIKSRKACFATTRKCASVGFLTPKVATMLFDSFVSSVMNYASEIWGRTTETDAIEKIQLRYMKFILGVKQSTCSLALYGELGRFPVHLKHMSNLVAYWIRLLKLPDNSLVKRSYHLLLDLDNSGFKTWAGKIREILTEFNMEKYWEDQVATRNISKEFVALFKETVFNRYRNQWYNDMTKYPKMRTYIKFKQDLRMETYLLEIRDFKLRRNLSKLRLSSHKLEIETGRYNNITIEQRICRNCDKNCVEDEEHALIHCPSYSSTRARFFMEVKRIDCLHTLNFIDLMKSKNIDILFCLAKFISKIFAERKEV